MGTKCPRHKIKIPKNREVVKTDRLKFPWQQDKNGYFLVKIEDGQICCGFVNNKHEMILELRGKNMEKMIKEIAKRKLVGLEQMGYISSELIIAKDCLKNNKKYIQR
ncbi:MAG: hypothetical protein WC323_01765 [Patescibacteria group bacterium]|jgi:hypothetical protein